MSSALTGVPSPQRQPSRSRQVTRMPARPSGVVSRTARPFSSVGTVSQPRQASAQSGSRTVSGRRVKPST
jgi:hypothetical protein